MNQLRILHLEDDPIDARLVAEYLRRADFTSVVTVVDGRDKFETAVQVCDFDLILADYNLPAFSGVEALKIAQTHCPNKSFIFVSGAIGEERAVDLLRNGATDFVWKDRLGRLAPAISRAMAESEERNRRRQAEAALRESEARFTLAQARGGIGVWEWDVSRGVTYWSDTMWTLYGLEPHPDNTKIQELWVRRLHSEDRENLLRRISAFFQSSATEFKDEFRIVLSDGGLRWLEVTASLDRDAAGLPQRMLGVNVDISERKESELALREADRRKDEFLATLAHELRNPLAPIRNSLSILRLTGDVSPATERIYEMMERQVNQMVRLVDDLLEVSRITRGRIALRKEPVEVAMAVRSAIETSRPLIAAAEHELHVSLPNSPLSVEADPVRLSQVIANLLNNSAKYTKPGGQIWLNADQRDNHVAISIRDNGIGIPAKMLPNIFQMFTQVDTEHKGAQAGLGIGLALVKTLVEMHSGRVEVHSDGVDQGSTFTILLPLAACGTATDPGSVERVSARLCRPNRVLVVDDNADAAFSLGMLLKIQGSEVHIVNDGLSALDAVKTYQPSVILLDIGMPGLSGYEVARRIREQPQYDCITLVAVTGWAQEEDRKRTRAAGFAHHLVKPVDLAALQALLASLESTGQPADCLR